MIAGNSGRGNRRSRLLTLHGFREIREELIRQFLGRAVDQALAELCQLAADLRLDIVGERSPTVLLRKRNRRATLGKSCNAALAFAGDPVAVRRIEIAQRDTALEA